MFGKIGEMGGMLKKAYEMKKELEKIKEQLANVEVKGVFGTSVEAVATGAMKIKSIKIVPEAVKEGEAEKIQDMVTIAVNNALEES